MPKRSFDPVNTTVLSLLDKHLSVPKYQRPYTWKTDNIELLWEDLYLDDSNANFLGIIVLHDANRSDDQGTHRLEIIDGQQRITTITILLTLIRNLYDIEGYELQGNTTQNAIETANALGSQGYILYPSARLKEFYELNFQNRKSRHDELMQVTYASLTDEQEKLVRNYRKAYELITAHSLWNNIAKREAFLTDIKNRILRTELIEVTVRSEDDAYDLFETLNARSVSLSEVNMIKNRIFMVLSNELEEKELENIWGNIEINAGGTKRTPEDIQKFINYFWWSRYEKIPPKKIFRELRNENDLEQVLHEFESDSKIFQKLKSQDSSQLINFRHISLTEICSLASLLKMQQVYISLLSIARRLSNESYWSDFNNRNMEPLIRKLEKFIFAYKFSEKSPAALERVYSRNAIKIFNAQDRSRLVAALLEFEKDLNEHMPSEDDFKKALTKLEYIPGASQNNRIISYVLGKIYYGDNPEIVVNAADLEHIFPQTPLNGFSPSEREIEANIHTLGNLTPLKEEINRQLCKNKRPSEKFQYYRDSSIIENHVLADKIQTNGWTSDAINTRTQELVDRMWQYINS